jgi:hypothetical protein
MVDDGSQDDDGGSASDDGAADASYDDSDGSYADSDDSYADASYPDDSYADADSYDDDSYDDASDDDAADDGTAAGTGEFDPLPAAATDSLTLPGLSLPPPTLAQEPAGPRAQHAPAAAFQDVPPAPHHTPSTIPEKIADKLTTPPNTQTPSVSPTPDPYEHEKKQAEAARQSDIKEHTIKAPEIPF